MSKKQDSPVLAALAKAAKGLVYTSETESPLEPFAWEGGAGKLTHKRLLELAGAEPGTAVEESSLDDFLHAVPPEDKAAFDKLAAAIKEQLTAVTEYKVGDGVEKEAFVVGRAVDGHWAGLKTALVETEESQR